ncbi:MAG: PQQ-binding-like beta-propeller repeat protein [Planctomycetota bacterium]
MRTGAPASLLALLALLLLAPGFAARQRWSQFRGPAGGGVAADEHAYPARLSVEDNLAWRVELPPGHSSPSVWDERVFVTGCDGKELVTLCLERATGALLWRRAVEVEALERTHDVNGPASPTPAVDGERVYAYFGSFGLLAYDLDGEERWRRPLEAPDNTFGSAASPVLADGRLFFLHDSSGASFLEAIEPATGRTLWRRERPDFGSGWSTPTVWRRPGGAELLVYGVGWLMAYDPASGAPLWSVPGLADEPIVTPVAGAGLVFVSSYNMRTNPEVEGLPEFDALLREHDADGSGTLDAREAEGNRSVLSRFDADGEGDHPLRIFFRFLDADRDGELTREEWPKLVRWVESFQQANGVLAIRPPGKAGEAEPDAAQPEIAWQADVGVPECPSPLCYDGLLFVVKNGGMASCYDAASGTLRYRGRLGARGPCYASPVAGGGRIYTASARGVVTVLAAGDELQVLSQQDLGERVLATPALAGGFVYVRTESALYAFGPEEDGD